MKIILVILLVIAAACFINFNERILERRKLRAAFSLNKRPRRRSSHAQMSPLDQFQMLLSICGYYQNDLSDDHAVWHIRRMLDRYQKSDLKDKIGPCKYIIRGCNYKIQNPEIPPSKKHVYMHVRRIAYMVLGGVKPKKRDVDRTCFKSVNHER